MREYLSNFKEAIHNLAMIRLKLFLFIGLFFIFYNGYSYNPMSHSAFIENKGQILDHQHNTCSLVKFLYDNNNGLKLILGQNSFSYECYQYQSERDSIVEVFLKKEYRKKYIVKSHRIDIQLKGSNTTPEIISENPLDGYDNYYTTGTPEQGILNVKKYQKITYKEIYPHTDLIFYILNGKPKYEFVLHPGASLTDIKLEFSGAVSINKTKNKNIEITTSLGIVEETIPVSYIVEENDLRKPTKVEYLLEDKSVSFQCLDWSTKKTLVIDPVPNLDWGTYYGASHGEQIAVDKQGNVIAGGFTDNNNIIISAGAHQSVYGGYLSDAYIAKFTSDGIRLWGTYYGGEKYDRIHNGVVLDSYENIVVSGYTESTGNIAIAGAFQTTLSGESDNFVAKFTNDGVRIWATYCGGNANEGYFDDIAVDPNNNIILLGSTTSISGIATPGAYQTAMAGVRDSYVIKFTTNGNIIWGTYYGGEVDEFSIAIAVDSQSNIYFTGSTQSTTNIASPGAHQTIYNNILVGTVDVFLVKLTQAGTREWGTYYGGIDSEFGLDLVVDSKNNIILTGQTESSTNISTPGAHQESKGGTWDSFIAKFNSSGSLNWATYFGGLDWDLSYGVAIDSTDNIYITGETRSDNNIATPFVYKEFKSSLYPDVFIAKFDSLGKRIWGTYYGGHHSETSNGIAIDSNNDILIIGFTQSVDSISTLGAYQMQLITDYINTFIAKFTQCITMTPTISSNGPLEFCSDKEVILTVSPLTSSPHVWSTADTTSSIHVSGSGYFSVTTTDSAGCSASSKVVKVTVYHPPALDLGPDITLCEGIEIVIGKYSDDSKFIWSTGDTSAFIKVNQPGLYNVSVSHKDCPLEKDSVTINYISTDYFIPNLITKNGDGKNDVFLVENSIQGTQVYIYNRWGEVVYENSDYKNDWVPTNLSDGIYYYKVKINTTCIEQTVKGWVHIMSE